MEITSPQNPKIKQFIALQQKASERRKAGLFVVEGIRELSHCVEAGYRIHSLFVCPAILDDKPLPVLHDDIRVFEVTSEVYAKMAYREGTRLGRRVFCLVDTTSRLVQISTSKKDVTCTSGFLLTVWPPLYAPPTNSTQKTIHAVANWSATMKGALARAAIATGMYLRYRLRITSWS